MLQYHLPRTLLLTDISDLDWLRWMRHRRRKHLLWSVALLFCFCGSQLCWAQQTPQSVSIEVHADQSEGPITPVWNYFGYDEPNYTYAPNGKKLLGELAAANATPAFVRVHNLLTTGDGSASLKWGSTNVYTEDASGHPVYSWTILDQIFDTLHAVGVKPIVEIGFMPEALSTHPEPYRHDFPRVPVTDIYTGWAYPPKDYQKWSELVFQFVRHLRERYGDAETKTWLWEVWNEPDIGYWQGTREEYFKLYDFTVDAVLRASSEMQVGGPETTGPAAQERQIFSAHFSIIALTKKITPTARLDRISISSAFIPRDLPHGKGTTYRWGSPVSLLRSSKGSKS